MKTPTTQFELLLKILPGPDRKRTEGLYIFRMTYRNQNRHECGCLNTWEVQGGREPYQIALELEETGKERFHCTCADAIFRGSFDGTHVCKHIHGLLEFLGAGQRKSA